MADHIILTTADTVAGRTIDREIDVISAECVFGMNMLRDFFASMRDMFGGRSSATQNVLRDSRETALRELREEAAERGADAVIGIDLDYTELSGDGKSMVIVVATGTAVKLA